MIKPKNMCKVYQCCRTIVNYRDSLCDIHHPSDICTFDGCNKLRCLTCTCCNCDKEPTKTTNKRRCYKHGKHNISESLGGCSIQ